MATYLVTEKLHLQSIQNMNWIEIDAILYKIIARHDNLNDMLEEAQKQFKWTRGQADDAIRPLLNRMGQHTNTVVVPSSKKTKRK